MPEGEDRGGLKRPHGPTRFLARLPIALYRLRLGWILGRRFLLLIHTGRVTGLPRQTVLEVVRHDPTSDAYFVASAWGGRSDWFRNVTQTPLVEIVVGRRRQPAIAAPLSLEETARELSDYGRRHPSTLRALARMLGQHPNGTRESYQELARHMPIVALRPAPPNDAQAEARDPPST